MSSNTGAASMLEPVEEPTEPTELDAPDAQNSHGEPDTASTDSGTPETTPALSPEQVWDATLQAARELKQPSADSNSISSACDAIDAAVRTVRENPDAAAYLLNHAIVDISVSGHAAAVGHLAILLGHEVFGPDATTLRDMGLAGLFHDLGKRKIDAALMNKTDPLSVAEMSLLQHHVIESVHLLGEDPKIGRPVRQMILQHHERIDGRGFPLGLPGNDLLPGSKVLAIADCFHALLGPRPGHQALTPAQACEVLRCQLDKLVDRETFRMWEELFKRQYDRKLAETVQHSDGELPPSYHRDHFTPPQKGIAPRNRMRSKCHSEAHVRCVRDAGLVHGSSNPMTVDVKIHDLSPCGLCLKTPEPMYRGEIVRVQIHDDGPRAWVRGIVRWCRRTTESGRYLAGIELKERLAGQEEFESAPILGMDDPELFPDLHSKHRTR